MVQDAAVHDSVNCSDSETSSDTIRSHSANGKLILFIKMETLLGI